MNPDAETIYRALTSTRRIGELRRLTYRCHAQRCLLLDAAEVPAMGLLLHVKGYKNSRTVNEATSVAEARAARTTDGNRHWRAQSFWGVESSLSRPDIREASLYLNCDHVLRHDLTAQQFHADWDHGHHEIAVRSDHSYVVLR
ncbi:hypothetical protein NNL26_06985 [Micrococcus luteus]|uniref:hypothetical protein n=1 Tax=Micrococcus luteus TaxID=1270 RepID=UPI002102B693|nr:hypothetical protein [Micrococcus luteus]UTX33742.1 hypothetical protein NNL26_06985 [Micrococcus luteus]